MFDIVEMRYVMPIPTDAGDEILLNFHECMSLHISFNYFEVDSMSSGRSLFLGRRVILTPHMEAQ